MYQYRLFHKYRNMIKIKIISEIQITAVHVPVPITYKQFTFGHATGTNSHISEISKISQKEKSLNHYLISYKFKKEMDAIPSKRS